MIDGMQLFQLLTIVFCAAMILRAVSNYRRGNRTARELVAWIAVWGGVAAFAAYPRAADAAGRLLGIKSGSNAVLAFAVVVLFYLALRSAFRVEQLEDRLTELTRELALRDLDRGPRDA